MLDPTGAFLPNAKAPSQDDIPMLLWLHWLGLNLGPKSVESWFSFWFPFGRGEKGSPPKPPAQRGLFRRVLLHVLKSGWFTGKRVATWGTVFDGLGKSKETRTGNHSVLASRRNTPTYGWQASAGISRANE